jgi:hypothetical protein
MSDFTLSWFTLKQNNNQSRSLLLKKLIETYSSPGDVIFDPFLGNGETLEVCHTLCRNGISFSPKIEIVTKIDKEIKSLEKQLQLTAYGSRQISKQLLFKANLENLNYSWQQYDLPKVDLIISFLPSWPSLIRWAKEFYPGHSVSPLGIIENILLSIKEKIKDGARIVLLAENSWSHLGHHPFAWQLTQQLKPHFTFKGEKICCIERMQSKISETTPDHKYLLIFRNHLEKQDGGDSESDNKTSNLSTT